MHCQTVVLTCLKLMFYLAKHIRCSKCRHVRVSGPITRINKISNDCIVRVSGPITRVNRISNDCIVRVSGPITRANRISNDCIGDRSIYKCNALQFGQVHQINYTNIAIIGFQDNTLRVYLT